MRKYVQAAVLVCLAAALFAAAAWGGIALTREFGRVAAIWLCNGLLVSLLLVRPASLWPWLIGACYIANVTVDLMVGDTLIGSLSFSAANSFEVLFAAFAMRGVLSSASDLLKIRVLARFFGYCVVLAPAASGVAAATVLYLVSDSPWFQTFTSWWAADALGMAMMVPLALAVRPRELRESIRGQRAAALLLPFALLIVITAAVFSQSTYPLLFLIFPTILLIAFRLGFTATAVAIFLTAAIALAFTIAGHGPLMLVSAQSMTARILTIQLLIGTLILTTYPVCAVVARQRQLLREVAANEERFRIMAVNSNDVITLTDARGAWQYLSPAVTATFGWAPEELLGSSGVEYVHPEDALLYSRGIEMLRHGSDVISGSFRMRHRNGSYVWVETISRVLRDSATGEITGWVSNSRDISARKRVEQLKDEFVSTVSHELRTPLTAIIGAIGLAGSGQYGALNQKLQRLLDIARINGERLSRLVDDILDFEKVSSGRMRFDLQAHAIDELIDQAVAANEPYAQRLGIRLLARHRVPGTMIRVDRSRFQQIMANLLSNAAKFSTTGSTVEIDAGVAQGRCRISVTDHGCGIPARFQERLFERFSQADGSDLRARGGTGLGMAIAQQLTQQMSGAISFESTESVGTTFHLDFSVAPQPRAAPHSTLV